MRLVAFDPFVNAERARQLGVQLVPTIEELFATCDFVSIHATKTPQTIGLVNADGARARQARAAPRSTRAAAASSTRTRSPTRSASGQLGGAAIDTFATEPTTESPLFALDNVVVTPHLGASTSEAQDKAGVTIAEQVVLALRGDFVPFAVNVARDRGLRDGAAVPAARRTARPAVHRPRRWRARDARDHLRG